MLVVDTSVWIDYFNGKDTASVSCLDRFIENDFIVVGDIVLMELLQGFRLQKDFETCQSLLDTFLFREMLGKDIAVASAKNYRYLRQRGVTVRKSIDVVIGTFCLENQYPLLHSDKDFLPMEKHLGLKTPNLK